jgi:hypothetical protein
VTGNAEDSFESAIMSEAALSEDWDRPEEDEAWADELRDDSRDLS